MKTDMQDAPDILLRHSATYLVARGTPGVINLLALALYTRLVSPEEYGKYVLVIAGVGLANLIIFQWLRLGLVRFFPAYQEQQRSLFSTLLAGFVALVVLSGLLGGIVLFFIADPVLRGLVVLGTGLLWVQAWFEINLELPRVQLQPRHYGFLALAKALLAVVLGGTFAYLGLGAFGLLLGLTMAMLIPGLWQARWQWTKAHPRLADRSLLRQLLAYGSPLTVTFLLGFIISTSDRFLLGWFLAAGAVGEYGVGYDLAQQSLGVLMMVVNLAAYPLALWALEQKETEAAKRQLSQNLTVLLAIALPATAGLALLAPNIARVFLGQMFRDTAASLIPWVAFGTLLGGVKAYYFDLSFQLGRRTLGQVWVVLTAAVVNVILNLHWIPRFGIMGAAYATVIGYAVGLVLSWALGRRIFILPLPGLDTAKVALATFGMSAFLWPFRAASGIGTLAGQVACGAIVYGALLWLLNPGGLRHQLQPLLQKIWRRRT